MTAHAHPGMTIKIKRLESGWWRISGEGPCEWAQVPIWPCDAKTLLEHAFPEASDRFLSAVLAIWGPA